MTVNIKQLREGVIVFSCYPWQSFSKKIVHVMGHIWFHWNINFFKDFFFFFFFWLPGLQLTALILISCSSSTCWAAVFVVLKQSREVCPQWRRWLSWIAKWWRRWKTLQKVNLKRWLMDSWESATVRSTCSREVALAFVIFSIYHHVFFLSSCLHACLLTIHVVLSSSFIFIYALKILTQQIYFSCPHIISIECDHEKW